MGPLIWHKNWGVTKRTWEGVIQRLPNISEKFSFLAEFLGIFDIFQKTVIYMMRYLAMHHWRKSGTNSTSSFGGVILEKPPRSSQKLYFLLLRKHLKVYNLTTRNGIMMKLTRIMYLYDTFHLVKNWGVTRRA